MVHGVHTSMCVLTCTYMQHFMNECLNDQCTTHHRRLHQPTQQFICDKQIYVAVKEKTRSFKAIQNGFSVFLCEKNAVNFDMNRMSLVIFTEKAQSPSMLAPKFKAKALSSGSGK